MKRDRFASALAIPVVLGFLAGILPSRVIAQEKELACPRTLARELCPFCTPRLMVDLGFCKGHNVPEAFCALCNPDMIPALKAAGDWCEEHKRSETFCWECAPAATGSGDAKCRHDMTAAACPFCTPELIVSTGFCDGHGVPEARSHLCQADDSWVARRQRRQGRHISHYNPATGRTEDRPQNR